MGDERLIQLVKRHEVIYNVKCDEYRDAALRNAAWMKIAKLHGKSVEECKDRWHRLRSCYCNALRRRERFKKSSEAKKEFPPWRFQVQMSFLKPLLGKGKRPKGYFRNINNNPDDDSMSDDSSPPHQESVEIRSSPSPSSEVITLSRSSTPSSTASYKRKESSNTYIGEDNRINIEDMDELDTFFLSMSKSLKKLPRMDQIRIKMDLLKAVCDAELKHLREQENTSTSEP